MKNKKGTVNSRIGWWNSQSEQQKEKENCKNEDK